MSDSEGEYSKNIIKLKGVCPTVEYGSKYRVYCTLAEVNQYGETYEPLFRIVSFKCIKWNKYIQL